MNEAAIYTIGSVILISLISLVGILLFLLKEKSVRKWLLYFVSFSTGALLGDVFLHLIPEMIEGSSDIEQALMLVLMGIVLSFIIEKLINWTHCHLLPTEEHYHPVGIMSLVADTLHNFLDGLLIAGSYLVSIPLGLATTLAVIFHEIPQEIGDFAILLYSGFKKGKALLFNLLTASSAIVAAILVLLFSNTIPNISAYLIPLTAGHFLYIAGSDLIPELHKEQRTGHVFLQLVYLIAGIGVMYALTLF